MNIYGNEIYLREILLSDCNERYLNWLSDPDVCRYMECRFYRHDYDEIIDYIKSKRFKNNSVLFAICLNVKNGLHIGNVKLDPINWIHRRGEVGIMIGDKNEWGKGYATEAINLITHYAFHTLNLHKVTAGVYAANRKSARAFSRAGFKNEAILVDHVWTNEGYQPIILMGKIKNDA